MKALSEDKAPGEKPKSNRDSIEWWLKWITAAKKKSKRHWEDAKAAYKEYEYEPAEGASGRSTKKDAPNRHSIYWSAVKTLEPAYYAKSPVLAAQKLFGVDDPVANTMSLCLERIGAYFLANSEFDAVMSATVLDFINADKATAQVDYKCKHKEQVRVELIQQVDPASGMPQLFEPSEDPAQPLKPYQGEVMEDEAGPHYIKTIIKPEDQSIHPKVLPFCHVLHSPEAKMDSEITEKAYWFSLEYDEAVERFGEEKLKTVKWKESKNYDREEHEKDRTDLPGKYLEGWECYSLVTNKVYWVVEDHKEGFIDEKPDPYGLVGLFPSTKFVISSKPSLSLFPTPAYVHVEALCQKLHKGQARLWKLWDSIKRRCIIDGSIPELKTAIEKLGDAEFVTVRNLQTIVEKGGLENVMHWVPVQDLVAAIPEVINIEQHIVSQFNEWFGVPDILRGYSDPTQPMGATEIQQQSAHDRFKKDKKRIQGLARDLLELMIDMALRVFVPEKIAQICGLEFMEPVHQENFWPAIEALKNDDVRLVRIDIETDSTSFADEQAKANQNATIATTITQGLQSIAQISQANPALVPPIARTLLAYLETVPGGKQFQDDVRQAVKEMMEAVANPPETPPPPDYEAMTLEVAKARVEVEKLKVDNERVKLEADQQTKNRKLDQEAQKADMQAMIDASIADIKAKLEESWQDLEKAKLLLEAREQAIAERSESRAMPQSVTINAGGQKEEKKGVHLITPIMLPDGSSSYRVERAE